MELRVFSWKSKQGLKIFGQIWQPEGKPRAVIILVHGLGEHIGRYAHVARFFTQAGIAMVGFDLPGHGQSEGKRGHSSYEDIYSEIDHAISETGRLFPRTPVFLYGHSLGGAIVLSYGIKVKPKVQGVLVTSPGLKTFQDVGAKIALARVLSSIAPAFVLDNGLDQSGLSHDVKVVDLYKNDPLVHGKISTRLGLDLITTGKWVIEHASDWPSLPLLLMQGTEDRLVNPQGTAEFAEVICNRITYIEWPGFYHELHNEPSKDEVFQTMLDWIQKHLA